MTIEALDKVLSTLNADEVIRFFKDMPEKERKSYAPRALEWLDVSSALNNDDAELKFYLPGMNAVGRMFPMMEPPKRIQRMLKDMEDAKATAKNMPLQAVKPEAVAVAELAALAATTLGEIRKRDIDASPDHCYEILSARKPSWLASWVDWICGEFPHTHWKAVRRLELAGVIQPEHGSNYLTAMALTLVAGRAIPAAVRQGGIRIVPPIPEGQTVADLLADEQLLPEIWRMLEDDQTMRLILHQESSPSWRSVRRDRDVFAHWQLVNVAAQRWATALVQLCQDGQLSKMQLLQSVMALFVRFNLEHSESGSTLRIDWFTDLHDKLEPSLDDKFVLHQDYLRLLACRNPKVVAWAAEKLAEIVEHPEFPVALVCESIPAAFLLKGKEHSTQALKTLKVIAERHPSEKREVVGAAIEALESESQDVQKRALSLIEKLKFKDDELVSRMQSKLSRVAITHRAQAEAWIGGAGSDEAAGADVPAKRRVAAVAELSVAEISGDDDQAAMSNVITLRRTGGGNVLQPRQDNVQELKKRSGNVPAAFSRLARLDDSLSALESGAHELPALEFRGDEIPRLDPDKQLKPLESIDDLIFFLARTLQNPWNTPLKADELEIALDGFARLGAERPDDFAARTEAIKAKVIPLAKWTTDPIILTTLTWTTGEISSNFIRVAQATLAWHRSSPVDTFLNERFHRVARDIVQGRRLFLMSTPTHEGGWIDPMVLVERVAQGTSGARERAGQSLFSKVLNAVGLGKDDGDLCDQGLALLRLAPDNRAAALEQLKRLPRTEFVDAFRYALGDQEVPIGKTPELWIAAVRARTPFEDDRQVEQRFPWMGPDAACVAKYDLRYTTETPMNWDQGTKAFRLIEHSPGIGPKSGNLISVRMHMDNIACQTGIALDWRRSITPMNLDSFFADGIEYIVRNDGTDSLAKQNTTYLETLYDPDVPVTRMAKIALVLALGCKSKDVHATAIEALIACMDDGRLNGTELGAVMHELYTSPGLRPAAHRCPYVPLANVTRWAKALAPAAQGSTHHAMQIAGCIERFCQGDAARAPKDLHLLLEILLTCLMDGADCLQSEETRQYLTQAGEGKGASKTTKLIKQLLALKRGPNYAARHREALSGALEKRVERAERWAR